MTRKRKTQHLRPDLLARPQEAALRERANFCGAPGDGRATRPSSAAPPWYYRGPPRKESPMTDTTTQTELPQESYLIQRLKPPFERLNPFAFFTDANMWSVTATLFGVEVF